MNGNDELAKHLEHAAHDFRNHFSSRLGEKKTDEIVEKMLAADAAYATDGAIVSGVFWVEVRVNSWDGQDLQYTGEGGGVFTPGGGALVGAVYTDDLPGLLANTSRFEVNAAAAYTSIVFFDDDSNCLGSYQSGSVSTVVGIGGGKGTWGSAA
jgi:Rhodococcus equi virulence-associated protein